MSAIRHYENLMLDACGKLIDQNQFSSDRLRRLSRNREAKMVINVLFPLTKTHLRSGLVDCPKSDTKLSYHDSLNLMPAPFTTPSTTVAFDGAFSRR